MNKKSNFIICETHEEYERYIKYTEFLKKKEQVIEVQDQQRIKQDLSVVDAATDEEPLNLPDNFWK